MTASLAKALMFKIGEAHMLRRSLSRDAPGVQAAVGWIRRILRGRSNEGARLDLTELGRRLDVDPSDLRALTTTYREISVPKKRGGRRSLRVPDPETKAIQRRVHRRLLRLLVAHPAATGFEIGQSIATNARRHVGRAVILRMDVRDSFATTRAKRVQAFFRRIGWDRVATDCLVNITTHAGGLPPGAPTSPRLSNLVNYGLDSRLAALATHLGATYTRYADDMTYSFDVDDSVRIAAAIRYTDRALRDVGYAMHRSRKLHIRRRHQQQIVTGLVVNERPNLPRHLRRRLRAIEHTLDRGRPATMTRTQLDGWKALQSMVDRAHGELRG